LAQVRQKRGETVIEYIQHFREVKNRCYSTRITEKEAVELASLGLAKLIKDMGFQLEFNSLVHLVQKLTSYEQRHPEIYQDKFKCQITLIDTKDTEDSGEEQEGWLS
jgi:UDP-glucose 4-epimerase